MTEFRFTASIRRALDDSAARLPPNVTRRLETAREAALAEARDADSKRVAGRPVFRRLVLGVVTLAAIVGGLLVIDDIDSRRHAVETAELEAAVLTDIVPIAAYADRGFGVYLRNSRQ